MIGKNKITLRSYIALFYIAVVIAPGIVSILVARSLFQQFLLDEIDRKNESFIQMMQMQIDAYLNQPVNDILVLASKLDDGDVKADNLQQHLQVLTDAHVYFESVRALSSDGLVIQAAPYEDEVIGIDVSRMEYFIGVKGSDNEYWAPSFISEQLNQPMTTISVPWKGGVIVGFLKLGELEAMVRPVGDNGSIFAVTDQTGTFIAHTNPLAVEQRRVCPIYSKVGIMKSEEIQRYELKRKSGLYYCYFSTIGMTGWSLISCQPVRTIHDSVAGLSFVFVGIGTAVTAFFGFIAFMLLQKLLIFFKVLTSSSNLMAMGDFSVSVPTSFVREISELSDNFNTMADCIMERDYVLRWTNEELKLEVEVRNRKEKEVEEIRSYLDKLIEAMPAALIGVLPDQTVLHCNSAACKMFNVERASINVLGDIVPDSICSGKMIENASNSGNIGVYDWVCVHVDAVEEYYDVVVYPLGGADHSIVIKVECVTEKFRMREIMMQTEKMTSVGGLAAGMAHEINNPLSVIMQSIQNGIRRFSPDLPRNCEVAAQYKVDLHAVQDYMDERSITTFLKSSLESCQKAAEIVRNMLQFSRKRDSELVVADLADIVDKSLELGCADYDLAKKYDFKFVRVIKEYDDRIPHTQCCVQEIEQVLLNLFKNALQAMEKSGDESFQPRLTIRLRERDDYVRLEIEDNGPGISSDNLHRIFEPFFTTKPTGVGTGLGLSVSYMIITQNHHGIMDVQSIEGHGTTFIIELPAYTA